MQNHISPRQDDPLPWLLPHCHRHRFPAKATIIKPGDPGDTLYYIAEGSCSVIMHNKETNQDIILAYLNKGDFIGEMGIFMGPATRDVFVRAREPSQLAAITYARLHQLLGNELSPHAVGILTSLGRQLSHRLLETSRKIRSFAFLDASGRITDALKDLAKQPDAMTHPDGMQIRVTRQEIGRIVGCSREMAGRVLKSLEEQGLIHIKGKTIVVYGAR